MKAHGRGKTVSLQEICKETKYAYDQLMALNNLAPDDDGHISIPNGAALKLPVTSGAVLSANHKPVIDVEKSVSALEKNVTFDMKGNSKSEFKGVKYCSHYVFQAINAGLPKDKQIIGPGLAKDAGAKLLKAGFTVVLNSSAQLGAYMPKKGDVVVLQDYPGQEYKAGHIAMYDGKEWVSDFKQTGAHHIWADKTFQNNRVGMVIYRP